MGDVYASICAMESDIIKAYRKLTDNKTYGSKSIEKKAFNLYEIISNVLERCDSSSNECTGRKEALESKADRMWRIYLILKGRRYREDLSDVVFFESKTAFKRRVRTAVVGNVNHVTPQEFFKESKKHVLPYINSFLEHHKSAKVSLIFDAYYNLKDEKSEIKHFRSPFDEIFVSTNLEEWFKKVCKILEDLLSEFEEIGSGWSLEEIISLKVNIVKTRPLNGSSFIELPEFVRTKHAVVNMRSAGNQCFAWAVIAGLNPAPNGSTRQNELSSYPHWRSELKLDKKDFPIAYSHIPKFERDNNISVNVYEIDEDNQSIYGSYRTERKRKRHVNLLLLVQGDKSHYCTIKHLSRLVSSGVSAHKHKVFTCETCFHCFSSKSRLEKHFQDCKLMNECKITLPRDEEKMLKFRDHWKKQDLPHIIYADFECLLVKMDRRKSGAVGNLTENHFTSSDSEGDCNMTELNHLENLERKRSQLVENAFEKHEPYSVGLYYHDRYNKDRCFYKSFKGRNCTQEFIKELERIALDVQKQIINFPPLEMTEEDEERFQAAKTCHICGEPFQRDDIKARDHAHRGSGRFRGASHTVCNLNYQEKFNIPVVFHNLARYDAHFLIRSLKHDMVGELSVIPQNMEKYISFSKHVGNSRMKLTFIDSFKFLSSSLEKLAALLPKEDMIITRQQFTHELQNCQDPEQAFNLLTKKGVFCYSYLDAESKLNETCLPPIHAFYNSLTDEELDSASYKHAKDVWEIFSRKTLWDYADLYLKTDVCLLSDIFEDFRNSCLDTYMLDPAHFLSLPSFAWDAMLLKTGVEMELLTCIDQVLFVEKGIRGGLSQCSKRHAVANNKYMKNFDETKESRYILYLDKNNLYGTAMQSKLPVKNFKWVRNPERFDLQSIKDDSDIGYILEVDLIYPKEKHDAHSDYPFCPEKRVPPTAKNQRNKKLLATLYDKKKYVIHYLALKQALANGLILKKIRRVLQFEQKDWLAPYIQLNTELRKNATSDFRKELFKLMINAVFGKSMENVRHRMIVKLETGWDRRKHGAEKYISNPRFHRMVVFDEDFVAIELKKKEIKMNKPIYVGMAILDISKTFMFDFHYNYMLKNYNNLDGSCSLLYTDTDSFCYDIRCEDVYNNLIKRDCTTKFDTSNFSEKNPYSIPRVNMRELGMMKDEFGGLVVIEFVGIRAKAYAMLKENELGEVNEKKAAKGVSRCVLRKRIRFNDYKRCLFEGMNLFCEQKLIMNHLHRVYSVKQTKLALNADDDKRFILNDCVTTRALGHKDNE